MRVLVDSNVFLRLATVPDSVPARQRRIVADAEAAHVSIASVWEMTIKAALGKLPIPGQVARYVAERAQKLQMKLLGIELAHLDVLQELPLHHRDPFDRLIIAQALSEDLTLVTTDGKFAPYGVHLV